MKRDLLWIGIIWAIIGVAAPGHSQPLYDIYDLGKDCYPNAISNTGVIVGSEMVSEQGDTLSHAVIWEDGNLIVLPTTEPGFNYWADDIDDDGMLIAGASESLELYPTFVALWEDREMVVLGAGSAVHINNLGQMVVDDARGLGSYLIEDGEQTWLCDDGTNEPCPFNDYYRTNALNDSGQVVGSGDTGSSEEAFLWQDGTFTLLEALVDPEVDFPLESVSDINNATQIVGHYYNADTRQRRSFLIDNWSATDIGAFTARAINESGQVVGDNFIYQQRQLIDLNGLMDPSAAWTISEATAINDQGEIVGTGLYNNASHAFLMVPCEADLYYRDADNDGYGDPTETQSACDPPTGYIQAAGVTELITNGGMEGDSNWHDEQAPSINERSDGQVYAGHFARRLVANDANDGVRSDSFQLTAGLTYRITVMVYGDGAAPLRLRVHGPSGSASEYRSDGSWPVPPEEWTKYSWTFTAGDSGTHFFAAELGSGARYGVFYIDNVSLSLAPSAAVDCQDSDSTVHPGAAEVCNGQDDDCDEQIDEDAGDTYYQDTDGDGFGVSSNTVTACEAPAGFASLDGDCDDRHGSINPGAGETCNGLDDDCDGQIDEDGGETYYRDADGDGYGGSNNTVQGCSAPSGYVSDATDCDDQVGYVHPAAQELCNGVDDDCDLRIDEDCVANQSPTSDAGVGQEAVEGVTVTLDGSNSQDSDDGIASWHWEQTEGPRIVLANANQAETTFVAPAVDLKGVELKFTLTVTDQGQLSDSDDITITVSDNGIEGFPDGVITLETSTGTQIGLKMKAGGALVAVSAIDPENLADSTDRPSDLVHGLTQVKIKLDPDGSAARLICYLPEAAAEADRVYRFDDEKGWLDVSDQVAFNADRTQFEWALSDGDATDLDGTRDGFVMDRFGLAVIKEQTDPDQTPKSGSGGDGGCFIGTLD